VCRIVFRHKKAVEHVDSLDWLSHMRVDGHGVPRSNMGVSPGSKSRTIVV